MSKEHIDQYVDLFRSALEKGHRFVLCVECPSKATLRQTNIEDEIDVARLLEKFRKNAFRGLTKSIGGIIIGNSRM